MKVWLVVASGGEMLRATVGVYSSSTRAEIELSRAIRMLHLLTIDADIDIREVEVDGPPST
jgi:hypothetical protein